jgi:3-isopropylmalate/(R)-2-methylmalate dehydratase large subunit
VLEYRGAAIEALDMEARMTLCNMSIEAGAKAGLIAPDERTFAWLRSRRYAPAESAWHDAVESWRNLRSDAGAVFDREIYIDANLIAPMVTFGTSPDQSIGIQEHVPFDEQLQGALQYMQWQPGQKVEGVPIDVVFIGSCTNSRISDLRAAAKILKGRSIASGLRLMIVPGSVEVKRQAEVEGLARIFLEAGAEWREPGCSMCIAMNGDQLQPGQIAVSTSNRNFAGRQGKGSRTILASPLTAAATAVTGHLTDPRVFLI